jgi:hypothetical protein
MNDAQSNAAVDLSFRYLESDHVRALRAHYASRLRLRLDIVFCAALAVAGIYLWQTPGSRWLGVAFFSIAAFFGLMLVAAFTVIPRWVFRREPKFRDEYSLTFSSEGIRFLTAHIDSQLQWSMYSHALVDAHSYMLYYGTHQFTVIPKRVLQSSEQQQVFERLLTQHVSNIVRRSANNEPHSA